MIPDALDNPPRSQAQAAKELRERAAMLRRTCYGRPNYITNVVFAEADRLDAMAAELEREP